MMDNCVFNQPISSPLMTPPELLKAEPICLRAGQTSPRSPLEYSSSGETSCHKKSVAFALSAVVSPNCVPVQSVVFSSSETSSCRPISPLTPETIAKKRVSFCKTVTFKEIRHIKDFSPEEVEACWVTPQEYMAIRQIVKATVTMMMAGENVVEDVNDICFRGLEARTKAGSRNRTKNKHLARAAVLNEQDLQDEDGFCDPQLIAMVSMEASLVCRQDARNRALYDEAAVQNYLADVRSMLDTMR